MVSHLQRGVPCFCRGPSPRTSPGTATGSSLESLITPGGPDIVYHHQALQKEGVAVRVHLVLGQHQHGVEKSDLHRQGGLRGPFFLPAFYRTWSSSWLSIDIIVVIMVVSITIVIIVVTKYHHYHYHHHHQHRQYHHSGLLSSK